MVEIMNVLDMTKVLPKKTLHGHPFVFQESPDGKIKITYVTQAGRHIPSLKPAVVNKHIRVCKLFFEGLGLWTGDGHKTHSFGFTNSEPALIRKFLEFSDLLGVDRSTYSWRILTPKLPASDEKEIQIDAFTRKIGLNKNQFKCFSLMPNRNFVCIHLSEVSSVLVYMIWAIFEHARQLMLFNPEWAAAYLRGVIAADGTVHLRKIFVTIKDVGIATTKIEFQKLFMDALKVLGIQSRCDRRGVYIEALDGLEKAKEWRLLSLHPAKQAKFDIGMKNFWQARERTKYLVLKLLSQNGELTTNRFYSEFNFNERFIRRVLRQLLIGDYVKSIDGKKGMRTWRLSQKGYELLRENEQIARIKLGNLWSVVEGGKWKFTKNTATKS